MKFFCKRQIFLYLTAIFCCAVTSSFAATFNGAGTGAIPDGTSLTPPAFGAPLNVTFNVSGLSGPPSNISISTTLTHTYIGDLDVLLIAPNGSSAQIFGRVGLLTATGFGDSSDLSGTYNFFNTASTNFWTPATDPACGSTCIVAAGNYLPTAPGGAGQTNPAPVVNLAAAFAGVSNPNGTWTLRFRDATQNDTGSVTAAVLTLDAGDPAGQHIVDYDGDSKTDFAVARAEAGGQIKFYVKYSGAAGGQDVPWGLSAPDYVVAGDYDGDGKTDITVWRETAGVCTFYILQSSTGTARIENFGVLGDDPGIVGDYDGDGKDDLAVYRPGVDPGQQSTWYWRTTANGPVFSRQWGQTDDFPYPGDVDGDGKNDFTVQREGAGGVGYFWTQTAAGTSKVVQWGLGSDFILTGDYDGDGKTDYMVSRTVSGERVWYLLTQTGATSQRVWGIVGDTRAQGDYDGDGKTDIAVWRPGAVGTFYIINSGNGSFRQFNYGTTNDFAVAAYNNH
jgi:subtilisin-like proprotein convertase family protein